MEDFLSHKKSQKTRSGCWEETALPLKCLLHETLMLHQAWIYVLRARRSDDARFTRDASRHAWHPCARKSGRHWDELGAVPIRQVRQTRNVDVCVSVHVAFHPLWTNTPQSILSWVNENMISSVKYNNIFAH